MLLSVVAITVQAQFLRTSYFMEGSHYRQQLNPALAPGRGYLNLPVIGSLNVSANSSSLGFQDIMDIIDNSEDGDYFTSPDFMNRLDATNNLSVNFSTDIISAGWYKGKNFWSFNVGLRNDIGASISKSMFQFMREMNGVDIEHTDWSDYHQNMGTQSLEINSYMEVGVGLSRSINERLTVGGRVKALLGIGNMKLNVENVGINTNINGISDIYDLDWSAVAGNWEEIDRLANKVSGEGRIEARATLESSFKGLVYEENENGYIDNMEFEGGELGLAGYGIGIDLGASYKVMDRLTVSASILDLGFIKWSKGSTQIAEASSGEDLQFDFNGSLQDKRDEVERFAEIVGGGEVLNFDMLQMKTSQATKSRTSSLTSTVVIGAEYEVLNWLAVGALYTGRFTQPETLNELTFSANMCPKNYLNLAVSYSLLQGAGKTFGLAAKLGPVFIGTDYMFLGENTKNFNAYLGVSIPLNKQKKQEN